MEIEKIHKEYLINTRIKAIEGKINSIDTEEDSGDNLTDLQQQIQALTNMLEMI